MLRVLRSGPVLALTVCSALLSLWITPLHAQQRQTLYARVAAPAEAQLVGRMPGSQRLSLAISLPLHDEEQLDDLLQQLYDPASPRYRQFLTVAQFTEQFGPTEAEYLQVIGFAQSHGLEVTHTFPNRLVLDVTGSVADIEGAFQVTMRTYWHPTENRTFYAPDVEPSVDPGVPMLSVDGLSSFYLPHSFLKHASAASPLTPSGNHVFQGGVHSDQTGSGPGGLFLGSDIRVAYGGGTALDGAGQVVGLIELGSYRYSDVLAYFQMLGQPLNVPIVNVLLNADGVCSSTEPPPGPCDDGEEVIDIQQAISMAPNLSALIVYEAYSSSVQAVNAYNQAASDNLAKQLSLSFGFGGTPSTSQNYENVFKELAAQGTSSFVASGDSGANVGGGGYPGNSPNITDAGGTDLVTASAGGAWQSETGWLGSGGGWNTQSPIPDGAPNFLWSQGAVINQSNGGNPDFRNIPDVSAEANTDNFFCANGSCQGGIGGTSLASPRWAAFMALINQQATANATAGGDNPTVGFLNPVIYPLGQGANYDTAFHDITSGSNPSSSTTPQSNQGSFNAVQGFDLVTGWGSPNGPGIFGVLAPTSTNANFALSATPLPPGGGGTITVSVTGRNGFSAVTNLSVVIPGSGTPSFAPPGMTASLSAPSIPAGGGSVTLTVSTTSATPGGTYVVAVVGTSGNLTQTAYVTVALPGFVGLTATPAGVSLTQGGIATSTISIVGINGFNGSVSLSASGLPSGVTAQLTNVNSTTAAMTLSATSSAALTQAARPYTVTVTGAATGSPSQSVAVNVFLNPAAAGGSGTQVDLSADYNLHAFYTDANESSITASNSLDGVGFAYSANLLNTGTDLNDTQFTFGPANQLNAVFGTGNSIALPAGSYGKLEMLATGIEGTQSSQVITVTYTDGTTSQFTQSFSDWCSTLNGGGCTGAGNNPGESVAVAMPYRDSAAGGDNRIFYLYHYSFSLSANKTVQSLTLPSNRNVIVLAATLDAVPPTPAYSLSVTPASPSSIAPGGSSTATVNLTPASGYTGSVTLVCSVRSTVTFTAAQASCSFGNANPVAVTSGGGTATVTFSTEASSSALSRRSNAFYALWLPFPGLAMIGLGLGSGKSREKSARRKKLVGLMLLWLVLASLVILPACGSSGSSGAGSGGNSGTPAGTYTITISAKDANNITQSNAAPTVTVTVN